MADLDKAVATQIANIEKKTGKSSRNCARRSRNAEDEARRDPLLADGELRARPRRREHPHPRRARIGRRERGEGGGGLERRRARRDLLGQEGALSAPSTKS